SFPCSEGTLLPGISTMGRNPENSANGHGKSAERQLVPRLALFKRLYFTRRKDSMPIQTRMRKSGRKRVYKKSREGLNGELDQAARGIFGGQHPEITPGAAGLTNPLRKERTGQAQSILQAGRRRKLASLQKSPRSKRLRARAA